MFIRLAMGFLIREVMLKSIHRGKSGEFLIRLNMIMKSNQVRNIQGAYDLITNIFLGDTTDDVVRLVRSLNKRQRQQLLGLVASDGAPDEIKGYIEAYGRVRVENKDKEECRTEILSSLSPGECQLLLDTLYPNDQAFRQAVQTYNTPGGQEVVDKFLNRRAQQVNAARNLVEMSSDSTTTMPARLRREIMSAADMLARDKRDKNTGEMMKPLWGHDTLVMLVTNERLQTDIIDVDDVTKHLIGVVLQYAIDIDDNLSKENNNGVRLQQPTLALRQMTEQSVKGKGQYFEDTTKLRGFVAFLIVYVVVEIVTLLYDCVHVAAAARVAGRGPADGCGERHLSRRQFGGGRDQRRSSYRGSAFRD
jgi:hypothetical protein